MMDIEKTTLNMAIKLPRDLLTILVYISIKYSEILH